MSILIDANTRVLVQGITGNQGSFHTARMLDYGTKVVAGVSPGKGGQVVHGVPVFDTVAAACEALSPDASILFIPAPLAKDAILEALSSGIKLIVVITEHIPLHDEIAIMHAAKDYGARIVGPNTFGLVSSGKCKIGIMPNQFYQPGPIGVVSRSGTLSYQIVANLLAGGLGTSTVVGLGGDRIVGMSFVDILPLFNADPETKAIVLVGEIGGSAEEDAARFIAAHMSKPVIAFIAGKSAPPGKRMGHAGAIIERGRGTYQSKVQALEAAGVKVAHALADLPELVKQAVR